MATSADVHDTSAKKTTIVSAPDKSLEVLVSILQKAPMYRQKKDLDTLVPLLQKIEFFKSRQLSPADLIYVAQCLTYQQFKDNEHVIEYGTYGSTFYIILEGRVGVLVPITVPKAQSQEQSKKPERAGNGEEKKEAVESEVVFKEVAILATGKSFGELALITNKAR